MITNHVARVVAILYPADEKFTMMFSIQCKAQLCTLLPCRLLRPDLLHYYLCADETDNSTSLNAAEHKDIAMIYALRRTKFGRDGVGVPSHEQPRVHQWQSIE
jgi:hypothetical protein